MIRHLTPRLILSLATLALAPLALAQPSEGIVREGAGARRVTLDAMELKPFPADLWAGVDVWAGGDALTPADTSGKPVIIISWASWYAPSVRALSAAQRIADQYAADGLIVVGLHSGEGWDEAESTAKAKNITFRLAHDAGDKVRAALHIDQDPDIYVIDRAGQLRFADVDASSLDQAAKMVSKESMDAAAKINQTLAERAEAARISANRTAAINQKADLTSIPELPFPDPSPDAYANATWPRVVVENGRQQDQSFLALPAFGWYPAKEPLTKGRAVIVYFWNPDVPATARLVKEMDLLQRERGRDVAVAGIVVPTDLLSGGGGYTTDENAKAIALELLGKRTKEYADSNRLSHPITFDSSGSTLSALRGTYSRESNSFVALASSDGVVRWSGDPRSPSFKAAVETVLANDPGIKSRRAVEQAWLKARGQ